MLVVHGFKEQKSLFGEVSPRALSSSEQEGEKTSKRGDVLTEAANMQLDLRLNLAQPKAGHGQCANHTAVVSIVSSDTCPTALETFRLSGWRST